MGVDEGYDAGSVELGLGVGHIDRYEMPRTIGAGFKEFGVGGLAGDAVGAEGVGGRRRRGRMLR